jgi:inosine-uridine nucleoside N-ribohydrolase
VGEGIFSYMWDELSAASIIDPKVITKKEELYIDCEFAWGPDYGKTVWWSKANRPWWATRTWKVQTDIDRDRFEKLFVDLMTRPSPQSD